MEMISIQECLEWMQSGRPFSCEVVAYDRKRKTGGEIVRYAEAILVQNTEQKREMSRPKTAIEEAKEVLWNKKNPSHKDHYTRNICILADGVPTSIIKKIHPPLLLRFNGKTVVP